MKGVIAEEVDCISAERTQAGVQTQIDETLVNMLQLGNSTASNGVKNGVRPISENKSD